MIFSNLHPLEQKSLEMLTLIFLPLSRLEVQAVSLIVSAAYNQLSMDMYIDLSYNIQMTLLDKRLTVMYTGDHILQLLLILIDSFITTDHAYCSNKKREIWKQS